MVSFFHLCVFPICQNGYKPCELGYIKPVTQCEEIQLVSKYCEKMGIEHMGIGPIRFFSGFTKQVLDGKVRSRRVSCFLVCVIVLGSCSVECIGWDRF
jgi:hypothetical protein